MRQVGRLSIGGWTDHRAAPHVQGGTTVGVACLIPTGGSAASQSATALRAPAGSRPEAGEMVEKLKRGLARVRAHRTMEAPDSPYGGPLHGQCESGARDDRHCSRSNVGERFVTIVPRERGDSVASDVRSYAIRTQNLVRRLLTNSDGREPAQARTRAQATGWISRLSSASRLSIAGRTSWRSRRQSLVSS
jgi:hypothetical protein